VEGLALQFLELESKIIPDNVIVKDALESNCNAWDTFTKAIDLVQFDDSGI
jgi:hypothetical protein